MVLYHVITVYHLLVAILHKRKYQPEAYAVLLLPDFFRMYDIDVEMIRKESLFCEVYFLDYSEWAYNDCSIREYGWRQYRAIVPHDLEEFEEIVVAGVQFPFALFLVMNHTEFSYVEESATAFLRCEEWIGNLRGQVPQVVEIGLHYGILDASNQKYITRIYAKVPDGCVKDDRIHLFDPIEEMKELSEEETGMLQHIFSFSVIPDIRNTVLLLTAHLANLNHTTLQGQMEIYALLADIYAEGRKLVVKPHPSDLLDYSTIFSDAVILPSAFPIELLYEKIETEHCSILTLDSTSLFNLVCENVMDFPGILSDYRILYRMVVALELFHWLSADRRVNIFAEQPLKRWMAYLYPDVMELDVWDKNQGGVSSPRMIFLSSDNSMEEYDGTDEDIIVLLGKVKKIPEDAFAMKIAVTCNKRTFQEKIVILCRERKWRKKIEGFHVQRFFPYLKGALEVEALTERDIDRLVWEGKMELLEKEIEKEKKDNEELRHALKYFRDVEEH